MTSYDLKPREELIQLLSDRYSLSSIFLETKSKEELIAIILEEEENDKQLEKKKLAALHMRRVHDVKISSRDRNFLRVKIYVHKALSAIYKKLDMMDYLEGEKLQPLLLFAAREAERTTFTYKEYLEHFVQQKEDAQKFVLDNVEDYHLVEDDILCCSWYRKILMQFIEAIENDYKNGTDTVLLVRN